MKTKLDHISQADAVGCHKKLARISPPAVRPAALEAHLLVHGRGAERQDLRPDRERTGSSYALHVC